MASLRVHAPPHRKKNAKDSISLNIYILNIFIHSNYVMGTVTLLHGKQDHTVNFRAKPGESVKKDISELYTSLRGVKTKNPAVAGFL
ncbi:MAG: hypothetical protein HUU10_05545 [Bacteroidetes bacterium]|nr:hypothetical protein [Bacteroidota bacterium]